MAAPSFNLGNGKETVRKAGEDTNRYIKISDSKGDSVILSASLLNLISSNCMQPK